VVNAKVENTGGLLQISEDSLTHLMFTDGSLKESKAITRLRRMLNRRRSLGVG
jgi:hypothetical protein